MEITIVLTESQAKALSYVAVDPEDWVNNVVHERCRTAMEEIFQVEVERMLADSSITEIPADREAVVLASTLPSAAEKYEQALLDRDLAV
jgi:phosphoserine aminotransferase